MNAEKEDRQRWMGTWIIHTWFTRESDIIVVIINITDTLAGAVSQAVFVTQAVDIAQPNDT